MGDQNQILFVRQNLDLVRGPVLEVGSRNSGTTPDFRALLRDAEYVGTDMCAGTGVDIVADLASPFEEVDRRLVGRRFATILCFSVLEHCRDPFRMCDNLTRLLADGGTILVSAPFSWEVHDYPSDFWRFTADGIKALLPRLDFDDTRSRMATSRIGQMRPVDGHMFRADTGGKAGRRRGQYGLPRALLLRLVRRLRLFPFIFDYPYVHPPVMVQMVGRKTRPLASTE